MSNLLLVLAILAANVIAILVVYQFVKRLPKKEAIIFIAIGFAITYICVSIIYWISGFGIDSKINSAAKDFMIFLFVPIDVIILVPFFATKYTKFKEKKIKKRDLAERIVKIAIVALIILIIECIYMRQIKNNIKNVNNNIEQNTQTTQVTNTVQSDRTNEIINTEESKDKSLDVNEVSTNIIE